jgi:aminoglycoside 6'-N-acetyltransferase
MGAMALSFRPLERSDFPLLAEWLGAPHVDSWWPGPNDLPAIEAKYGPRVDGIEPTEVFVVEADHEPIGMIQRYRIRDYPEWEQAIRAVAIPTDAAGIDYLIGVPTLVGRGVGPKIIGRFVDETWRQLPDVSAIAVSVQQANRQSWRALEKVGFRRAWDGMLASDDPSDAGPSYIYLRHHPARDSTPIA